MRKLSYLMLGLVFACLRFDAAGQGSRRDDHTKNVSILSLIGTPKDFDGKAVSVTGFLDMDTEGALLYLHKEDYENSILSNAVWIRRDQQPSGTWFGLNHKYIKVSGIFSVQYTEQLGVPPSGISDVQAVSLWSDPADPASKRIKRILERHSNP